LVVLLLLLLPVLVPVLLLSVAVRVFPCSSACITVTSVNPTVVQTGAFRSHPLSVLIRGDEGWGWG